jgi:hypothetical protein
MNRDAQSGTRMVFDIEEMKLGNRDATQYSLDVANLDGMPVIPEIRQAMERFFGPGGKLRMWVVPVDEKQVLLAAATQTQVTAALEAIDRQQVLDWNRADTAAANKLLPREAAMRLFLSPHGQSEWHRRQMEAMNGAVIGGPVRREFPNSPPIGFSVSILENELRVDAAVPRETSEAAGEVHKK